MERRVPKNIYLESTNLCNAKCTMCPNEKMTRARGTMTWNTFDRCIEQLEGYDLSNTTIYLHKEGEPLIDPLLVDKIKQLKEKLPLVDRIALNTNAALMTRDIAQKLIESGLDTIFFSLDSCIKENYEGKRIGLSYDTVVSNIEVFLKENAKGQNPVHVVMQMLVDESNQFEIEQYKEIWSRPGVEIFIKKVHDYLDMNKDDDTNQAYIQNTLCNDPFDTIVIYWDGSVGACCWDYDNLHQMGDISRGNVLDIFNNEKFTRLRTKMLAYEAMELSPCSDCSRLFGKTGISGISSLDGNIERQGNTSEI